MSEEIYIQLTKGGSVSYPIINEDWEWDVEDGTLWFTDERGLKAVVAKGGWEFAIRQPIDKTQPVISDTGAR
jgi:hypothetical protein